MSDIITYFRIYDSFSVCSFQGTSRFAWQIVCQSLIDNGDGEIRTLDPLLARQVLSQLSYAPNLIKYFN